MTDQWFQKYKIQTPSESCFYIPDYLSISEHEVLLRKMQDFTPASWRSVTGRKLQMIGGTPETKGMIAQPFPSWLQPLADRMQKDAVFSGTKPNHILINEYHPGDGILRHTDGPLYHPSFGIVSLGSAVVMNFYKSLTLLDHQTHIENVSSSQDNDSKSQDVEFRLLLEPRSLLIITDTLYADYLHEIPLQKYDTFYQSQIANAHLCHLFKSNNNDIIDNHKNNENNNQNQNNNQKNNENNQNQNNNQKNNENNDQNQNNNNNNNDDNEEIGCNEKGSESTTATEKLFVVDRELRYSFTIRNVKKVLAKTSKLFGKTK